jgi:alkylation response protein AidB-like acyl-CoA dehydrogenase
MQTEQTPEQDPTRQSSEHQPQPDPESTDFREIVLPRSFASDPSPDNGQTKRSSAETDLELHKSTADKRETHSNLFETSTAQERFIAELIDLVRTVTPEKLQHLDENKLPALELLQSITSKGIFVNGVPLPEPELARDLLNDPTLAALIPDEKRAALAEIIRENNPHGEYAELMDELADGGLTKAMLLGSIEIPKHSGIGIGTFLGVNNGLAAQSISKIGTPEQASFWLNALNRGVMTYGFGLTEEKVGSDPRSLITTFVKEQDEEGNTVYRLNGNKRFIGNAAQVKDEEGNIIHPGADFLVIYAVDDPDKAPKDRSYRAFMVPRSAIGEENIRHTGGTHNKMGLREVNNGDFELHDVVIPESCMLGEPDQDIYPKMLGLLDITRLFVGGMGNGAAEAAVEIAKEYASEREQNGRPIEDFQMVSFPLQDLEAEILAGRLLTLEAAELVDQAERQKETNTEILDNVLDHLEDQLALVSRLLQDHNLPHQQVDLIQAGEAAIDILERMQDSQKIRKLQPEFAEQAAALYSVTRTVRNAIDARTAPDDLAAVKECYRQLVEIANTISNLQDPVRFGAETAMSKLYNTELAERATMQAMNTLAGYGYVEDPEVGRGLPKRLRDAKVLTIYEGTSNIQRNLIAQGSILQEVKAMKGNIVDGLRFFMLKFEPTKRMYYNVLKNSSRTKIERANAAYKYAVVDVLSKYQSSLSALESDWKKNGVPEEYQSWDQESIDRQRNLMASLPVQARMGILADVSVQRKLLHLSEDHLTTLKQQESLTPEQEREKELLEHFQDLALEKLIALGRQLGSKALAKQEERYLAQRG